MIVTRTRFFWVFSQRWNLTIATNPYQKEESILSQHFFHHSLIFHPSSAHAFEKALQMYLKRERLFGEIFISYGDTSPDEEDFESSPKSGYCGPYTNGLEEANDDEDDD